MSRKDEVIEEILGEEKEKLKGFGKDINAGEEMIDQSEFQPIDKNGKIKEKFPKELLDKFQKLPNHKIGKNHKITKIKAKDNGEAEVEGIILDGKEKDPKTISIYGLSICSDKDRKNIENGNN